MESGAYGRRLGRTVGVIKPPTISVKLLRKAEFAATRVTWGKRESGIDTHIEREDAFLTCVQWRDIPTNPYWIGGRPMPMSPVKRGQFTMLDLNLGHASYLSDPIDCLAMYLPRKALDRFAEEQNVARIEMFNLSPGVAFDDAVVEGLAASLMPALERPEWANQLFIEHVALALLTHLTTAYGDKAPRPVTKRGGLAPWQARRASELLVSHIDGGIGLDELADACGLSRSHFARAFKTTMGLPPHRWLLARRLECARDLLLNSRHSLEEIAELCGFADQSHFTRAFANSAGLTPGEWRRVRRS